MFKNLIKSYKQFLIKRLSKKNSLNKDMRFSSAKKIALIYNRRSEDDETQVKKLINELKFKDKQVLFLVFKPEKAPVNPKQDSVNMLSDRHSVYLNDLNFMKIPGGKAVKDFLQEEFDMLIDLSTDNFFPSKYIAAKSRAAFKVGCYHPDFTGIYDFMINLGEKHDVSDFNRELNKYLNIFESNKKSA